jgi:hypothetical protein
MGINSSDSPYGTACTGILLAVFAFSPRLHKNLNESETRKASFAKTGASGIGSEKMLELAKLQGNGLKMRGNGEDFEGRIRNPLERRAMNVISRSQKIVER